MTAYVTKLPAANGKFAVGGFCWGGAQTFRFATNNKDLKAGFVFYGSAPDSESELARISCPIFGFYGENDARINASLPDVKAAMEKSGNTYTTEVFPGTGHGFLKPGRQGYDTPEREKAWKRILDFYRARLGSAPR